MKAELLLLILQKSVFLVFFLMGRPPGAPNKPKDLNASLLKEIGGIHALIRELMRTTMEMKAELQENREQMLLILQKTFKEQQTMFKQLIKKSKHPKKKTHDVPFDKLVKNAKKLTARQEKSVLPSLVEQVATTLERFEDEESWIAATEEDEDPVINLDEENHAGPQFVGDNPQPDVDQPGEANHGPQPDVDQPGEANHGGEDQALVTKQREKAARSEKRLMKQLLNIDNIIPTRRVRMTSDKKPRI
jgi:hypothetical protein